MALENSKLRSGRWGSFIYSFMNKFLYFLPILLSNCKFRRTLLFPLYQQKDKSRGTVESRPLTHDKQVVYMVQPETTFSGGLSDRLRAITSIYRECRRRGLPYKLVFEPLHLQDYLQPNEYDWRIADEDIIWDTRRCYPCTILTYHHDLGNPLQRLAQRSILRYFLRRKAEQIHIYSNMAIAEEEYGKLFKELFKPTEHLQKELDYHLEKLGGKGSYISVTFRFRQLLGDFKEGGETLPEDDRRKYIDRCIRMVRWLHEQMPDQRILVTADSSTFLSRLQADVDKECGSRREENECWLYTIAGEVVHIGFTFDAGKEAYMRSFIDYYLISYASAVYLVRDKLMYHSGFPERAAMLNGAIYQEIKLK